MDLSESIIIKYCVKNPELIELEKTLQKMLIIMKKCLNFTILVVSGIYNLLILLSMLNVRECIVTVHVVGL